MAFWCVALWGFGGHCDGCGGLAWRRRSPEKEKTIERAVETIGGLDVVVSANGR